MNMTHKYKDDIQNTKINLNKNTIINTDTHITHNTQHVTHGTYIGTGTWHTNTNTHVTQE